MNMVHISVFIKFHQRSRCGINKKIHHLNLSLKINNKYYWANKDLRVMQLDR
jgi:hypothetical protein